MYIQKQTQESFAVPDKITLYISEEVRKKLKEKHGVGLNQVQACFENRERAYLFDTREEHQTDPQTRWFIAEYEKGKLLKVCFMYFAEEKRFDIKTAYPPNQEEIDLYATAPLRASP